MWYWVQKFTNTKILFKFVGYWPMISIFCDIPGLEKKTNHVYSVIFNGKRIFLADAETSPFKIQNIYQTTK